MWQTPLAVRGRTGGRPWGYAIPNCASCKHITVGRRSNHGAYVFMIFISPLLGEVQMTNSFPPPLPSPHLTNYSPHFPSSFLRHTLLCWSSLFNVIYRIIIIIIMIMIIINRETLFLLFVLHFTFHLSYFLFNNLLDCYCRHCFYILCSSIFGIIVWI